MATTVSHQVPTTQQQAIADLTGYEDAATLRWQQACVQAANTLTALPNGRYVNVRMERMRQGLELAQRGAVTLPEDGELSATVRSGNTTYQVDTRLLNCTCADYGKHLQACKHILAVEVHVGALGLVPAQPLEPPPAPELAHEPQPVLPPSTASWPIAEAPASLNIKLKVGAMELMYTMRDVDDLKLQRRATLALPWLQDILHSCEANLEARQQDTERARQQAEEEKKVQARSLEEQIAAAVQAALKAQAACQGNGTHKPPTPPALEPTNDTDPSWCPIHRCTMERRTNERGSWYSHRLSSGGYCKGE
jgi:hypothetical protein